MITPDLQSYLSTPDEPPIQFLGIPSVVRATSRTTNGAFGLIEHLMIPPGFVAPYHTHHVEDEALYVLEGEMAVVRGGEWIVAGPGRFVFLPREIPHGFKVKGDGPVRMLLLCAPGGFEKFVMEMSEPEHAPMVRVAAKYKIDIHGKLPPEPVSTTAS